MSFYKSYVMKSEAPHVISNICFDSQMTIDNDTFPVFYHHFKML